MFDKRQVMTAMVTVALAFGVAHIMQKAAERQVRLATVGALPGPIPASASLPTRADGAALLVPGGVTPPQPTVGSAYIALPQPPPDALPPLRLPDRRIARLAPPTDLAAIPPGDDEINLDGFGLACDEDVRVTAAPDAALDIEIDAPCAAGATVRISHAGLDVALRLDDDGRLALVLPALQQAAEVEIAIADGVPAARQVRVEGLAAHDRVALNWIGPGRVALHALEFGSRPGEAGHVSAQRPTGGSTSGGTITSFGESDLPRVARAQVYSFPSALNGRAGSIRLAASVAVDGENCGKPLSIRAIRATGGEASLVAITEMILPPCSETGDILVLKNLFGDLKIASN